MNANMKQLVRLGLLLLMLVVLLVGVPALLSSKPAKKSTSQSAPVRAVVQNALGVEVAQAANVTKNLCASDGTISLPGGGTVDVWGFVETNSCGSNLVNDLNFPGPTINAFAGDTVTINLTNALSDNVSIIIPGQDLTATGGMMGTFTTEVATGNMVTYEFTAQEGTYLYESGTNAAIQIPMGLYGALIVDSGVAGQAYGYAFDQEAVLLLSEIDPNLNADPAGFDLLDYHPTYWLINGEGYPNTDTILANPGDQVLLRYLNAGFDYLSMSLLGAYQWEIARDAYSLNNPFNVVAETIPAGTTADMLVDTTGLGEDAYPLYNRNMYVTNADAYPGGMLTFIEVAAPVGAPPTVDIVSPAQGSTTYGDAVVVQINASDVEDAAGSLTVEWKLDGGSWQTASWTGIYYEASWDTTLSSDGAHTITARATDSDTNPASDSNGVVVSNSPVVNLVTPDEGATIFGDTVLVQIDASDVEDDFNLGAGMLTVTFDLDDGASAPASFNGGSGYYEATLDTTSLAEGAHTINAQATDSRTITGSDSNNITVSNLPALAIVNPADGANVFGQVTVQIDASDAEDDTIGGAGSLTVTWDVDGGAAQAASYNAGTGYYEANLDTTSLAGLNHTVNSQMTDSRGNMVSDSNNFMVTPPNSIHLGDLDDASVQAGGPNWSARVTVEVHDLNETPVEGATVFMDVTRIAKAGGTVTESLSCVTGANGRCTIARTVNENQYENEVTFIVTNVTNPPADPYDSGINHDPDGESDGTIIVVSQP